MRSEGAAVRALRYDRYGAPDVLRVQEIPEAVPRAGEAKVRVRAVALNPIDWKIVAGYLRFIPILRSPPRGTGLDFAGEIVGVGGGNTVRHVGERVMGSLSPLRRDGALAETIVVPYERLLPIPAALDERAAAALPIAGGTALQALADQACLAAGQRLLVIGAAGGVGHFAVQIGRHLGAYVVGVCGPANVAFVRELGADEAIDYATEDFRRRSDRFDVVFDAAGASSFRAARGVLTDAGRYLNTGGDFAGAAGTVASGLGARLTSRQRAITVSLHGGLPMWRRLADLAAAGVLVPRIERVVRLEEVPEAYRAMATGHGRGKIVVDLT